MKTIEISSKDNEKIKLLKKLGKKKYRNKYGKFIVENLAIIYDGTKSGIQPESLFLAEEMLENRSSKIKIVLERLKLESVFSINESINRYFSSLDTPSGIAAVYKKPKSNRLNFEENILYLNGIKDPGNVGAILRSALAFGLRNIVVDEFCADPYNPKSVQASKDAILKTNIVLDKSGEALREIKGKMKIFSTDVKRGESVSEVSKKEKFFCLVLGSESHGVDEEIKKLSDGFVNIKSDSAIESLNVAVSAGIILYEIYGR
ncbi:MAG: RNA methyltransferase [Parcubacteria group bacterium]|jgi:TrmH family RNA methyltransferase|nr:RNA methyltransferase [Candidatus Moranbacteria bacterium]